MPQQFKPTEDKLDELLENIQLSDFDIADKTFYCEEARRQAFVELLNGQKTEFMRELMHRLSQVDAENLDPMDIAVYIMKILDRRSAIEALGKKYAFNPKAKSSEPAAIEELRTPKKAA